jgi:hypothetical protein
MRGLNQVAQLSSESLDAVALRDRAVEALGGRLSGHSAQPPSRRIAKQRHSSKKRSRSGRRSIMARARSCSLPFILSRNGVPTSTCRPCSRASSSVASLSSGCRSRTESIFSRRRPFRLLISSFALPSGLSGNSTVVPATRSGVAEGSGGGCNTELGFCGMSGKSGGRGGWSDRGRWGFVWFGHEFLL